MIGIKMSWSSLAPRRDEPKVLSIEYSRRTEIGSLDVKVKERKRVEKSGGGDGCRTSSPRPVDWTAVAAGLEDVVESVVPGQVEISTCNRSFFS